MGSNKLLLESGGRPLVRRVVDAAAEAGCTPVVVVVRDGQTASAAGPAASLVFNPDADAGMSSSIRVGLQALPPQCEATVILLADQPLVSADTIRTLISAAAGLSTPAAAARFERLATWTPPVYVRRSLWETFMQLEGDHGAREVFVAQPELLSVVDVPGSPLDIDTPEDAAKL